MQGSMCRALAVALALAGVAASPASAHHQPGDMVSEVFEVTIDVRGQYFANVTDSTGGSWTIQASPYWKVIFPEVPIAITDDASFAPKADYGRSDATAGPVTWAGTTNWDFMNGPDPFSCTGPLQGPNIVGPSFQYHDSVVTQGEDVKLELTTLNAFGLSGNGSCSPPQASITTGWNATILNDTVVYETIPRQELFENNSVFRTVVRESANSMGPCAVQGSCTHDLTWDGSLKLKKVCRNYAGTSTTISSAGFTTTNSFCESDCDGDSCSQEDFEIPPLAHPAKEQKGSVEFTTSCYGDSPCQGKLKLVGKAAGAAKPVKLGSATLDVEPAAHVGVDLKLSPKGRKGLAEAGKLKGTLKAALSGDVFEATDSMAVKIKD